MLILLLWWLSPRSAQHTTLWERKSTYGKRRTWCLCVNTSHTSLHYLMPATWDTPIQDFCQLGCVSRKHRMVFLRRRCVAITSPSQNFVSRRHRLLFCCSQSPNFMRPQQSRRKGKIPIAKCHSVRKMTALRNIPITRDTSFSASFVFISFFCFFFFFGVVTTMFIISSDPLLFLRLMLNNCMCAFVSNH